MDNRLPTPNWAKKTIFITFIIFLFVDFYLFLKMVSSYTNSLSYVEIFSGIISYFILTPLGIALIPYGMYSFYQLVNSKKINFLGLISIITTLFLIIFFIFMAALAN